MLRLCFRLLKERQIIEAEHLAYQVQIDSLQKLVDEQRARIKALSSQLEIEIQKYTKEKKQFDDELKSVSSVQSRCTSPVHGSERSWKTLTFRSARNTMRSSLKRMQLLCVTRRTNPS